MPPEKPSFVNVDELMRQIGLHQAAHFYGVPLPDLHRTGQRDADAVLPGLRQSEGDRGSGARHSGRRPGHEMAVP